MLIAEPSSAEPLPGRITRLSGFDSISECVSFTEIMQVYLFPDCFLSAPSVLDVVMSVLQSFAHNK